jgi:hypothetical protein
MALFSLGCVVIAPPRANCTLAEAIAMDFIEQLFGLSPDGGSGWFEFLLFAVPLAGIAYLAWRKRRNRDGR